MKAINVLIILIVDDLTLLGALGKIAPEIECNLR